MTRTRSILSGLFCVASCGEAAPGFSTEHLIVEPSDSDVMCRGTLDDMEAQLVRVAAALDVEVLDPIELYYGPSAVAERCIRIPGVVVGGCADGYGADTFIASEGTSLYHEIVHGVRRSNGMRGPSFFEEGIAVVLSGFRPFPFHLGASPEQLPPVRGPAALARSPDWRIDSEDYGNAGHFTAWLIETHGQETVAAFLNDAHLADAVDEVFTDHFAISLDDAELDWRADSDAEYIFGEVCDPARALAWSGDVLEYSARLACDEPHVRGPDYNIIGTRSACFPLEAAGTMRVQLIADSGELRLRNQKNCRTVGPLPPEHYQDKTVAASETIVADFAPCTWEVILTTELDTPTDFTLRLSR